ncbi:MAG: uracil-DNA glycosylase [Cyanobacteria bacterium SIG31]|nr:uracil-DNA glycosylase [Cyanobacteria bacterium SIG31]
MIQNTFGIDKSWIDGGLDIELISNVMSIISEKRKDRTILPSKDDVLNAIKLTSLDNVKVLIIGQDPYPSAEHAHGLAFSSLSTKTPASLKNIFKKLKEDYPEGKYESNTLTEWEKQGVLLLNTALTFEGKDLKLLKEHTQLWEPVIKNIFEVLIKRNKTLIVMRWGNYAQKIGECFDNKPNIYPLDTTHPSPFSARNGFLTCNHFKKSDEILGKDKICWDT